MTKENIVRLYNTFCYLASGKFNERDFDSKVDTKNEGEEAGWIRMGEMPSQRVDLIKSDAKRHKEDMEDKFPYLLQKPIEEVKEEINTKPKTAVKKAVRKA